MSHRVKTNRRELDEMQTGGDYRKTHKRGKTGDTSRRGRQEGMTG